MPDHAVTIDLPGEVYERVRRYAQESRRPLEAELLDLILGALRGQDGGTDAAAATVDQLRSLDSLSLWQLAGSHLSADESARLEALNFKAQREGLNADERLQRDALLAQFERTLLIRAEATGLLKERGVEAPPLARR